MNSLITPHKYQDSGNRPCMAAMGRIWMKLPLSLLVCTGFFTAHAGDVPVPQPIDREALFSRHNVVLDGVDTKNPLSVGNGRFAFTVDATGLQTFPDDYRFFGGVWEKGTLGSPSHEDSDRALVTMSEWGWHTAPNPRGYRLEDTFVDLGEPGRESLYPVNIHHEAAGWLRENPQQVNLMRAGFLFEKTGEDNEESAPFTIADIEDARQELDIWNGHVESRFSIEGESVRVRTYCLPDSDTVVVDVDSELIASGKLKIALRFPYAPGVWGGDPGAWGSEHDSSHLTEVRAWSVRDAVIDRRLDDLNYECRLKYSGDAELERTGPHSFTLAPQDGSSHFRFAFTLQLHNTPYRAVDLDAAPEIVAGHWNRYWESGGAIDLSESKDPRWRELERRIVLSQYLIAIQNAQSLPAGVSGLSGVSWHSIHHECAGFDYMALHHWNRHDALERTLQSYFGMWPVAREIARRQGYAGARWPFKFGAGFEENPSRIGPLLVWHIPNAIYAADAMYQHDPSPETLKKYQEVVFETAEFMASFARWNEQRGCYELGPPIISAREYNVDSARENKNPIYELALWQWGLETANRWRVRMGLQEDPDWKHVAENLAPLPIVDGIYVEQEYPLIEKNSGHPMMLGCLGMLPKMDCVDEDVLRKTLQFVHEDWGYLWWWGYPMIAMSATRLNEPELAIEYMLADKDEHRMKKNGHYDALPIPCNNSLYLAAAALMATGWQGGPDAPGFPDQGGDWVVRHEDLVEFPE